METMTKAELLEKPSIEVSGHWHLKYSLGGWRIWIDPKDGFTQIWNWRDGGWRSFDESYNYYKSVPGLTLV